jgi:cell division protein FtsQ
MTATATVRRSASRKSPPQRTTRRSRKRRSRRRKVLAFIVIMLVLALVGGSLWTMYFSTVLVTERVNVVGISELTAAQVSLAAQVPLGVPLARQDLEAIAQRTSTLPEIETASVIREWPRTITVAVVERRPVLGVQQPEGYVLVDKSGVAYQTQQVLPPTVVLTVGNPGDKPLLTEMATVAAALPNKLRRSVDRMTASNRDSIVLLLESGHIVSWGSSSDSELKAQIVIALLKREPMSYIDVSSPHNPAVR